MLADRLKQSIVVLIIMGCFFGSLIFLIGVAENTKTNNSIDNIVPLQ